MQLEINSGIRHSKTPQSLRLTIVKLRLFVRNITVITVLDHFKPLSHAVDYSCVELCGITPWEADLLGQIIVKNFNEVLVTRGVQERRVLEFGVVIRVA